MVICQYYLKGICKFGDSCFNEHRQPGNKGYNRQEYSNHYSNSYHKQQDYDQHRQGFGDGGRGRYGGNRGGGTSGRNQYHYNARNAGYNNRFAALSHQPDPEMPNFDQISQSRPRTNSSSQHLLTSDQRLEMVRRDMKEWNESGQWPLSCYATRANESCYDGLLDISPEELRVEAYKANAGGNAENYTQSLKQTLEKYVHRKRALASMTQSSLQQEVSRSSESNGTSSGLFGKLSSSVSPFAGSHTSLIGSSTVPTTTAAPTDLFGSSSQSTFSSGSFTSRASASALSSASKPALFGSPFSTTKSTGPLHFSSVQPSVSVFDTVQDNPATSRRSSEASISSMTSHSRESVAPLLKCSEQDMKAFKDDHFVLGSIPECPPPPELC